MSGCGGEWSVFWRASVCGLFPFSLLQTLEPWISLQKEVWASVCLKPVTNILQKCLCSCLMRQMESSLSQSTRLPNRWTMLSLSLCLVWTYKWLQNHKITSSDVWTRRRNIIEIQVKSPEIGRDKKCEGGTVWMNFTFVFCHLLLVKLY